MSTNTTPWLIPTATQLRYIATEVGRAGLAEANASRKAATPSRRIARWLCERRIVQVQCERWSSVGRREHAQQHNKHSACTPHSGRVSSYEGMMTHTDPQYAPAQHPAARIKQPRLGPAPPRTLQPRQQRGCQGVTHLLAGPCWWGGVSWPGCVSSTCVRRWLAAMQCAAAETDMRRRTYEGVVLAATGVYLRGRR